LHYNISAVENFLFITMIALGYMNASTQQ